jgi:hypothetical protein
LIYNYHLSNELDFGLIYDVQVVEQTPRYFYETVDDNEHVVSTYNVKYQNDAFDTTTLFDYTNYNVRFSNNGDTNLIPQSESGVVDYQY